MQQPVIRVIRTENGSQQVEFSTFEPLEAYEYLVINQIRPKRVEITQKGVE